MSADIRVGRLRGGGSTMVRTSRSTGGRLARRGLAAMVAATGLLAVAAPPSNAVATAGPQLAGRAYGLSVQGSGALAAASIPGTADSGLVIEEEATQDEPNCAVAAPQLLVASISAACGGVVTYAEGAAGAVAWVGNVTLNLVAPIQLSGLRAASISGCGETPEGKATVAEVSVAGMPVTIAPGPNSVVDLIDRAGVLVRLIVDERIPTGNGLTVNAARLIVSMPGGQSANIVLASASSAVANCPTT